MRPPLPVRKLLRPLIPDRVMSVVRLREHSRQVRVNVDVVVDGWWEQRRWLATTPDTYRVRSWTSFGSGVSRPDDIVVRSRAQLSREHEALVRRPLADPALDAAVLGEAVPPRLVGRRRTEPRVGPVAIAVRRAVWEEIGGAPAGEEPLPGVLERLRGAGFRYALVPLEPAGAPATRTDPIAGVTGSAVILALVPMHDIGGGSRGAQLALELVRQGWHVSYVAAYGTAESVDLGLRFVHPQLEQRRADELDVDALIRRVEVDDRLVICEAPLPGYLAPARHLAGAGYRVVYDLIDDWAAPALGGDWYQEDSERAFAEQADTLAASAPDLVARLQAMAPGREVVLVPNAVNAEIFGGDAGAEPDDLPSGNGPLIGYHGSLYGDWFDWDALRDVAMTLPDARIVVIGDDSHPHPEMPPNIHFLGLKPQADLPPYLQRLDVGLLPFRVTDVTHAVSPLKVFEYLASGVPVAAPPLRSLAGLDGIIADDLPRAVTEALAMERPVATAVLRSHSWSSRLQVLVDDHVGTPHAGPTPRTVRRVVLHHGRSRRHTGRA